MQTTQIKSQEALNPLLEGFINATGLKMELF